MAQPTDTDLNRNRIREVFDGLIGTEDPDDLMIKLMEVMSEGAKTPEVGKYYIFVYNPKTPNINYDQNPLVAVTDVFSWGFRGVNFHWGQVRQYTFPEVAGGLYEAYPAEIKDLQAIPFGNFQLNN
tara:strand:- start:1716 stop:2093 length:378 start_codon:yes stop_codon:yes gene_type:complete